MLPLWQRGDVLARIAQRLEYLTDGKRNGIHLKAAPQALFIRCLYTSFGRLLISSKALGFNFIYTRS